MRGAPAQRIQALAGHAHITTTERYMHLSPQATESAIRLLESPGIFLGRGNMGATSEAGNTRASNATPEWGWRRGGSRTLMKRKR
jgi:hypothetical protein